MNTLLTEHIAHLRRINARPDTMKQRRDCIARLDTWLDGRPALHQATLPDLERWQDALMRRVAAGRLAVSSVHTYVAHVRSFYSWAHTSGRLPDDPARMLRPPRVPDALPRPIPPADLDVALTTARGQLYAVLVLGAYLGLRAGEIARVTAPDIVRAVDGRATLIVHGKGGRQRAVPLDAEVLRELAPWLPVRGPMFLTARNEQASPKWVTEHVSAHFRGLGMPHTCHQLRHGAATRLLQLTGNLRLVQAVLGHVDPRTTSGYTGLADADTARAMGMLADDLAARRRRRDTRPARRPRRPGSAA